MLAFSSATTCNRCLRFSITYFSFEANTSESWNGRGVRAFENEISGRRTARISTRTTDACSDLTRLQRGKAQRKSNGDGRAPSGDFVLFFRIVLHERKTTKKKKPAAKSPTIAARLLSLAARYAVSGATGSGRGSEGRDRPSKCAANSLFLPVAVYDICTKLRVPLLSTFSWPAPPPKINSGGAAYYTNGGRPVDKGFFFSYRVGIGLIEFLTEFIVKSYWTFWAYESS